jgi:hypothetical protein
LTYQALEAYWPRGLLMDWHARHGFEVTAKESCRNAVFLASGAWLNAQQSGVQGLMGNPEVILTGVGVGPARLARQNTILSIDQADNAHFALYSAGVNTSVLKRIRSWIKAGRP